MYTLDAYTSPIPNPTKTMSDTQLQQDLSEQAAWILAQSGYRTIEHVFACNQDLFLRLAAQWRAAHSVV